MQAYKKQAGPFLLRSIKSIFSVLISVVADSPKGEAVTNQKYNKICDILSFIKCKTCDIHAVKKSLEIRLLLYSVGKTARTSLPCSNALTPWHCLGLKSKLKILWKKVAHFTEVNLVPSVLSYLFLQSKRWDAGIGRRGTWGRGCTDMFITIHHQSARKRTLHHCMIKISQLVFHISFWDANTRIYDMQVQTLLPLFPAPPPYPQEG